MLVKLQKTLVNNVAEFTKSLPSINVKFVFFLANKLDEPILIQDLVKFGDWHLAHGKDLNFVYAYKESEIKYIVTDLQTRPTKLPITCFNVKLNRPYSNADPHGIANIGNHVDFSIQCSMTDVFYSVHYISYKEGNGMLNLFTRNVAQQCNFLFDKAAIMSKQFAKNTACVDRKNHPITQVANVFHEPEESKLIHDLAKISLGKDPDAVLQAGGADHGKASTYKGLLAFGPELIKFVAATLIRPITTIITDVECIYKFLDQYSTLGKNTGKSMQYVVEFSEDKVLVFSISVHRALKACWTYLNKATTSEREKKCLRQWHTTCKTILARDFMRTD